MDNVHMKASEWEVLRETVLVRDLTRAFMKQPQGTSYRRFMLSGSPCVASFLDDDAGPCAGPIQLDHVKCQPMMRKKAPDNPRHLVSVCRGHHTDTRQGYQWATANRELEREYLTKIYGACTDPNCQTR